MSRISHSHRAAAVPASRSDIDRRAAQAKRIEEFVPDAARSSARSTRKRPYLAEDASQDALLAAYKALDSYDPDRQVPLVNYVRTVIARACWKADRAEARAWKSVDRNVDVHNPNVELEIGCFCADVVDQTLSEVIRVDLQQAIEAAVADLSPPQRALFELLHVHGLTQREAAAKLGVSQQRVQQINQSVINAIRRIICN